MTCSILAAARESVNLLGMHAPLAIELSIQVAGTGLILLPSKSAWWPEESALVISDTHFGKASDFRKAGIPVPGGTTKSTLHRLSQELQRRNAKHLLVVGDFVHSAGTALDDVEQELNTWRSVHRRLRVTVVRGNHDRRRRDFYSNLDIDLVDTMKLRGVLFRHEPRNQQDSEFTVAGHLHPAIALRDGHSWLKLPCFWQTSNQLVLPAFGEFTGTSVVDLKVGETAFIVCQDRIVTYRLKDC